VEGNASRSIAPRGFFAGLGDRDRTLKHWIAASRSDRFGSAGHWSFRNSGFRGRSTPENRPQEGRTAAV